MGLVRRRDEATLMLKGLRQRLLKPIPKRLAISGSQGVLLSGTLRSDLPSIAENTDMSLRTLIASLLLLVSSMAMADTQVITLQNRTSADCAILANKALCDRQEVSAGAVLQGDDLGVGHSHAAD